ncbi:MAG: amidase [Pseudomonadota bacterium]
MPDQPLWQLDAVDALDAMATGRTTATDLVASHLERLEAVNPRLNAVVNVLADDAMASAAEADAVRAAGRNLGPLHGVPVTVKVNVDLDGQPNSNGLPAMADNIAPGDSPVVANLKRAGAVILGQTNTPEFSMRWVTDNPLYGATQNPWGAHLTCGGSSGGAGAATAAGIGCVNHGNDIGGSLRWPAHCNGVATIKPTQGRVPSFSPSFTAERPALAQLFSAQGPIARSTRDCRVALEAMCAADWRDPNHVPAQLHWADDAQPCRVAVAEIPEDMEVDAVVQDAIARAVDSLTAAGYRPEPVRLPGMDRLMPVWCDLVLHELTVITGDAMQAAASADFRTVWAGYRALHPAPDPTRVLDAMAERLTLIRDWLRVLQDYPVILAPVSTARTPGPRGDLDYRDGAGAFLDRQLRFTTGLNLLGLPAAVAPTGVFDGMPLGVQLIGARYREMRCLHAAAAVERGAALDWPRLWGSDVAVAGS